MTVTYLQQLSPTELQPSSRDLPSNARIELVGQISPEFSRFLYQGVGSELNWADRLSSTKAQWQETLDKPGSETYVLYQSGSPKGYVELVSEVVENQTEVEIFYFGLFPEAIGQGLGGILLSEAIKRAWDVDARTPSLPPVARVWLHTCSLDGPAALPNYLARGFNVYRTEVETDEIKDASIGLWPVA